MEEVEGGISSLHSLFTDEEGKEDERKGQSCFDGVGKELLKLRNLEEDEGDIGSSMISGFVKLLQLCSP